MKMLQNKYELELYQKISNLVEMILIAGFPNDLNFTSSMPLHLLQLGGNGFQRAMSLLASTALPKSITNMVSLNIWPWGSP